jgi:uncharacterized protein (DUF58 family)
MLFQHIFRRVKSLNKNRLIKNKLKHDKANIQFSAQSLRQLNRLQLVASRYLPGDHAGLRSSLRRKPSYDFREHRMYVPGDDVRFIDWKASARQEHIFIKQGEQPKEAMVYILLDCSASMKWGAPPKHKALRELSAALCYMALAHGDRLIVVKLNRKTRSTLGPISGKGQIPNVMNYLRSIDFHGELDLPAVIRDFTLRANGGLVMLISDFLETGDFSQALEYLPAPTWDVIVFHLLHPHELNPEIHGDFKIVDAETGQTANYDIDQTAIKKYQEHLNTWRQNLEITCIENNTFYTLIPANWSLNREIIPHLRSMKIVNPL